MLPAPRRLRFNRNPDPEYSFAMDMPATTVPPVPMGDTPDSNPGSNLDGHNTTHQAASNPPPVLRISTAPENLGNPLATTEGLQSEKKPELPTKPNEENLADETDLLRGIGSGAQVWTTYVKEANDFDDEQVDGWNRSLDVTLVFAALFSAILTAFVLESVQTLQPDPAEITASTLIEISRVLQGMATGQPLVVEAPSTFNVTEFQPTRNAVWVNGLWFFSLSLSVAVSLAAMLAKQWCYYFLAGRTGDDITQAKLRQNRFGGIAKWRMRGILEMLPMLMHLSLAVFSAGLVLFLWDINVAVATAVTAVAVITLCFYLGTTLLPVGIPFCPFKTPQAEYTRVIIAGLGKIVSSLRRRVRAQNDLNSMDNKTRLAGFLDRVIKYLSGSSRESHLPQATRAPTDQPRSSTQPKEVASPGVALTTFSEDEDSQSQPFVKESLSWLIKNSQNSRSIDIAIGALAIGKVRIETSVPGPDDLMIRINSHLVKHFSDCFKTHKDRGIKLYLLEHRAHASSTLDYKTYVASALDYSRWMTYFAGPDVQGIMAHILDLRNKLGVELVTHLGLAFASLSESKDQLPDDSRNIAMWLSAFISHYDNGAIYFSEQVVSVMIDGLTATSLKIPADEQPLKRAETLAVLRLIQVLWKVSHVDGSSLRSSIGMNLAIFALKAKLHYPFYNQGTDMDGIANRVFANYQSNQDLLMNEGFAPFAMFSLLGFLHPKNSDILNLDEGTKYTICRLIYEPRFFIRFRYASPSSISQITQPDSFRRHMATMLIETMVSVKFLDGMSPDQVEVSSQCLQTAAMSSSYFTRQTFLTNSALHATCQLIYNHFLSNIDLCPEVLAAAADLFLREVKQLKKLDTAILYSDTETGPPMLSPSDFEWQVGAQPSIATDIQTGDATRKSATPEFIASAIIALIMSESADKQCIEVAVRAALHHSGNCRVELVVHAIAWFASGFSVPQVESKSQGQLLSVSGYARILASMVMHCPDPQGLIKRLKHLTSNESEKSLWEPRLNTIGEVLAQLARAKDDKHIYAFGTAALAVWNIQVVFPISGIEDYSARIDLEQLDAVWELISGHSANRLRSEALEALVDTTVLLAAFKQPVPKITSENIHSILELLDRFRSESEPHVRPALAVALTFWGLSFEDHDWDFWTHEARRKYWAEYCRMKNRTRDLAPLFLLGLSRVLAHYSLLELNHTGIKTITREIDRFMRMHANGQISLTLYFLPQKFDVRRHVRESVWDYLEETKGHGPFTRSANEARERLSSAITSDGGEGYKYEKPQPFQRKIGIATTDSAQGSGFRPSIGPARDSTISATSIATERLE